MKKRFYLYLLSLIVIFVGLLPQISNAQSSCLDMSEYITLPKPESFYSNLNIDLMLKHDTIIKEEIPPTATILILHKDKFYGTEKTKSSVILKAFPNTTNTVDEFIDRENIIIKNSITSYSSNVNSLNINENKIYFSPDPGLNGASISYWDDVENNSNKIGFQGDQYFILNPISIISTKEPSVPICFETKKPLKFITILCQEFIAPKFSNKSEIKYQNLPIPQKGFAQHRIYIYVLEDQRLLENFKTYKKINKDVNILKNFKLYEYNLFDHSISLIKF